MIPWALLDSARAPEGGAELRLYQRGDEYSIRADGRELMNSRATASEDAFARLACERLAGRENPRILIGGLGMGITLAAALAELGPTARVVVSELVPEVISWNRGPLGALARHPLRDPRVSVRELDVAAAIRAAPRAYDAILLDVDNGPEAVAHPRNAWLYSGAGLVAVADALCPGGVFAVWSASPDRAFARRLRDARFSVEEVSLRARGYARRVRHTVWIARPLA